MKTTTLLFRWSLWPCLHLALAVFAVWLAGLHTALAGPTLVSTASLDGQTVALCFASDLDPASAQDTTLYSIPGVTVWNATLLEDHRTVLLSVSDLTGDDYTVTATGLKDAQGDPGDVSGAGPILGWTVADLGNLLAPSTTYACGPDAISTVVDGGAIWFTFDACNSVYRERTGDFDIRVQVTDVSGGNANSNLTLDVRESADPDSRHVFAAVYGQIQNRWAAARRIETGGASSVLDGNWFVSWPAGIDFPNVWLRVKRSGETFTAYGGTNGLDWVQVGDPYTPDPAYPASVQVGLATAATDAGIPPIRAVYRNFGEFELANATIRITHQPQDATVIENRPANFTVGAAIDNGPPSTLGYQWQRDGIDIPGAVGASYTLPSVTVVDDQARFQVKVSAPGVTAVSSEVATLTVQPDTAGPQLVSTAGLEGHSIGICFDEALDWFTATDPSRYTVNGGLWIESALLMANQQTVVLQASSLGAGPYTLGVDGVMDLAGNPATINTIGQVLDYAVQDLGNLPEPSLVYACTPDAIMVHESGGAIWFSSDACNYVHQERTGDFDVRVQVARVVGGNAGSNLTLDARESAEPDSRHVFIAAYAQAQNAWAAARRHETAGASSVLDGNWLVAWPAGFGFPDIWLRLKRSGNTFTAYGSTNGLDWIQAGDAYTPDPPYPASMRLGLATAVTTGTDRMETEYRHFGDFVVTNAVIVITAQPESITVIENRPATFSVGATLENGPAGALGYQWQRDGADIPGAVGASYTVPLPAPSDDGATFRVRVSAPGATPVLSEAATLDVLPDTAAPLVVSAHALVATMVGVCFDEAVDPAVAGDPTRYEVGGAVVVESAELQAGGRTVVLRVSGLSEPVFALTATGIADLKGNTGTTTVTGVNAGMAYVDVGDAGDPGLVISCTPGPFTMRSGGADIWGAEDSFGFAYQMLGGDFDIRLQMTGIRGGNACTRAGLMVREDETPGSRNVFAGTYPRTGDNHWVATYRAETDAATLITAGGYIPRAADFAFPNAWFRLTRSGQTFAAYSSANGFDWTPLGGSVTADIPYPDPVMVGIASSTIFNCGAVPQGLFDFANYGPAVAERPAVSIALDGSTVVISWPESAASFALEETAQLGAAGAWTAVSTPPVQVGDRFQVTIPVGSGTRFFRLAQ